MSGHLFIVRGDLGRLACHAWLLPTDAGLTVTETWRRHLPAGSVEGSRLAVDRPDGWDRSVRSTPVPGVEGPTHSRPWMTAIGTTGANLSYIRQGLADFIRRAGEEAHQRGPAALHRRKPLLGVPLVGTGEGGGSDVKGEVVGQVLKELLHLVKSEDVDIALVTHDAAAFSASQAVRSHLEARGASAFTELSHELRAKADALGRTAARGDLVLFLGAGVSRGAGLPLWGGLLERLMDDAHLGQADRESLHRLPQVDQARILEHRLGRRAVADCIDETFRVDQHSLCHALLAGLPVREVVTTNYDELFELASNAAGRPLATLPYEPTKERDRWILKLHGSVGRPDVVITRDDYLSLPRQRGALAGIVQALLITRSMLFVGYSLQDDDFHQLIHDVRLAVRGDSDATVPGTFGSALLLQEAPLLAELWRSDIECIGLAPETTEDPEAARLLEIMLDAVLAEATTQRAFLLDRTYEDILTEDDRKLRRALEALRSAVRTAGASPAATLVRRFLDSLGDDASDPGRAR